jgi:hypothetical protein
MQAIAFDVLRARVLFALDTIKYGHSYALSQNFLLDAFFDVLK